MKINDSLIAPGPWRLTFAVGSTSLPLRKTVVNANGLTLDDRGFRGFASRGAAVAWVLCFVNARIVDTAEELSADESTVFIEEVPMETAMERGTRIHREIEEQLRGEEPDWACSDCGGSGMGFHSCPGRPGEDL